MLRQLSLQQLQFFILSVVRLIRKRMQSTGSGPLLHKSWMHVQVR